VRLLIIGMLILGLSGCASAIKPDLIATKNVVHMPPAKLFSCPSTLLPAQFNSSTDVAILLVQEHNNGLICQQHLKAIQQDLLNQQRIINTK
jgi:hypothetical protein